MSDRDARRPHGWRSSLVAPLVAVALAVTGCTDSVERRHRQGRSHTSVSTKWFQTACDLPVEHLRRIRRGHYPGRTSDVIVVPREPNFFGSFRITTHAGPWAYLQRVPLVFYGPGSIKPRGDVTVDREVTLADIAPTIAELLDLEWPDDRAGRPIPEVLVEEDARTRPRVVVTVVWDAGGWNVLNQWPDAWPHLRTLMERGASVKNATVGSSPSVTPAVHATIGTGAFPRQHGIVDIPLRVDGRVVPSYGNKTPNHLELATIADLYDREAANRSEVGMMAERNWHLGMLGHGAYIDGADKDVAVLYDVGANLKTNPDWYALPSYLEDVRGLGRDIRTVDREDGSLDDTWMGHANLDDAAGLRLTPVPALYQTRLLKTLLRRERYGADDVTDLLFTNYKSIDLIGHVFHMESREMESTVRHTDEALRELTGYLDRTVGRGRWALVLTADHGSGPNPRKAGAWPIGMQPLVDDLASHFDVAAGKLVEESRPTGLWLDRETMAARNITPEQVSEWLIDYRLEDNVAEGADVPRGYRHRRDERLFAAAFPAREVDRIWACRKTE